MRGSFTSLVTLVHRLSSRLVLGDELWHALLSSTTHVCIHLSAVKVCLVVCVFVYVF